MAGSRRPSMLRLGPLRTKIGLAMRSRIGRWRPERRRVGSDAAREHCDRTSRPSISFPAVAEGWRTRLSRAPGPERLEIPGIGRPRRVAGITAVIMKGPTMKGAAQLDRRGGAGTSTVGAAGSCGARSHASRAARRGPRGAPGMERSPTRKCGVPLMPIFLASVLEPS